MKSDLLEKYSAAAIAWDEWYASRYELATYPGKAVRVEQGEYGVVNRDTALGTYNVRQCVVVYLATKEMHGLAHIDGHTEIKSLKEYLDALGIGRDQILPHIKIIGARSKTVMGLNDSEANIRKVTSFLLEFFGQSGIDIGTLVEARPELTDFVISGPGPEEIHDRCLVRGEYNKEQALHTIQEIKRKDSYIGTYPIARANDGHSKCIFLDERAIVKLNEYLKNIGKDKRDPRDTHNYQAFDTAIPVILEEWQEYSEAKLLHLSHCTPLFIGDGANELNQSTLIPPPKYTNSANIDFVLQYCRSMDTDLSFQQVKGHLVGRDGVNIDCEVFGFDAGITAKKLLKIISRCSIKLYKLLMLHPQGAYDLDQEPYKIEQIKAILEPKELELLKQVIVGFNESLPRANDLTPVEYNEQISIQFQSRAKPLSRKQKMLLSHGEQTIDQKVGRLCGELQLDSGQISSSIRRRFTECKEIKIHEAQIKDSSNFSLVQTDFLSSLNLPNFSTTSIGMHLSEFAASSLYACDLDVGAKFLQVLVEVETLGRQEKAGHSEDFE